jgi:hypothetical protein
MAAENKDPRPQGGALKPDSKTKTEIPKQVRDDKKEKNQVCMSCLFQHLVVFSAFSRHTFHPRPQDGVFRGYPNKKGIRINYLIP